MDTHTQTLDTRLSRQMARRLSEASVLLENTPHPEIAEMLRVAANEIERLAAEVDRPTPKPPQTCPHATHPFRICGDDGLGCRAKPCPLGFPT
jgi:hypothetical protein